MIRALAMLVGVCLLGVSTAWADVSVGDSVIAHWAANDAYYIGTAVEDKDDGFLVVFEDGDQAVVPKAKVRENDVKKGSKVMAKWSDGQFYPGKVNKVVGRALFIHFDDGDKGWTTWSGIANPQPRRGDD